MIFGSGIPKKLIRKHHDGKYIVVDYEDKQGVKLDYRDKKIYGCFRTAGVLAIMVAHVMGASKISIVGMDGYTLKSKKDLDKGSGSQHCYGKGFTDDSSWKECVEKDDIVKKALKDLSNYGVKFSILTPTVFADYYDSIQI